MFFFAQMQCMSHYYKVIMCRAYCMDYEYTIQMMLIKSIKNRRKNRPHVENIAISTSHNLQKKIAILIC